MSGLPENRQLYEAVETTDWCAQPYSEYREGCKYTKTQLHKLIQIQRHNIRIQIHYADVHLRALQSLPYLESEGVLALSEQ